MACWAGRNLVSLESWQTEYFGQAVFILVEGRRHGVIKNNTNGVFHVSTLQSGLDKYNNHLGQPLTKPDLDVMKKETYKDAHLQAEAYNLKQMFMHVSRTKRNTSTGARHELWLKQILDLLKGPGDEDDGLQVLFYYK